MKKEDLDKEGYSLVKAPNWSVCTDINLLNSLKGKSRNDLICSKHKNDKLSLLIHEIEGFIIEESNLPFKEENESEEVSEITTNTTTENERTEQREEEKENELVTASTNSYPEDKDELMSLLPTKCKYCGNELPEQRAMWGKRFCSVSCGKKYSLQCSQRVRRALQRRTAQHSGPGRGRKSVKVDQKEDYEATPVKIGRGKSRRSSISSPHEVTHSTEPTNLYDDIDLDFTFPRRDPLGYGLDEYDVENELCDGDEPITSYSSVPAIAWSTNNVVEYIRRIPGCESSASAFAAEEIDGSALLLLKVEHMVQTMNLKLGPALKIASWLRDLKSEYGIQMRTKYLSSP